MQFRRYFGSVYMCEPKKLWVQSSWQLSLKTIFVLERIFTKKTMELTKLRRMLSIVAWKQLQLNSRSEHSQKTKSSLLSMLIAGGKQN